jgi:hypothetical protein
MGKTKSKQIYLFTNLKSADFPQQRFTCFTSNKKPLSSLIKVFFIRISIIFLVEMIKISVHIFHMGYFY